MAGRGGGIGRRRGLKILRPQKACGFETLPRHHINSTVFTQNHRFFKSLFCLHLLRGENNVFWFICLLILVDCFRWLRNSQWREKTNTPSCRCFAALQHDNQKGRGCQPHKILKKWSISPCFINFYDNVRAWPILNLWHFWGKTDAYAKLTRIYFTMIRSLDFFSKNFFAVEKRLRLATGKGEVKI